MNLIITGGAEETTCIGIGTGGTSEHMLHVMFNQGTTSAMRNWHCCDAVAALAPSCKWLWHTERRLTQPCTTNTSDLPSPSVWQNNCATSEQASHRITMVAAVLPLRCCPAVAPLRGNVPKTEVRTAEFLVARGARGDEGWRVGCTVWGAVFQLKSNFCWPHVYMA